MNRPTKDLTHNEPLLVSHAAIPFFLDNEDSPLDYPAYLLLYCLRQKRPASAPESNIPAAVSDLKAWSREGAVFLGWAVPTRNVEGAKLGTCWGLECFAWIVLWTPPARNVRQISGRSRKSISTTPGARIEGGRVLWQDTAVKPRNEYTYFVLAYNFYKAPSPESNRVKIFWDEPPPARKGSGPGVIARRWKSPGDLPRPGRKSHRSRASISTAGPRESLRFFSFEPGTRQGNAFCRRRAAER